MSEKDFKSEAWKREICDQFSWRGLLCDQFNFSNLNFSCGGSSNQKQFRLAVEFFGSDRYQAVIKQFDKIIVIWGITSTARNELWSCDHNDYYNFFYSKDDVFSRFMVENSFNHDAEVANLRNLMLYWNVFFESQNIDNFWFDTFNSHNYEHDFFNNKNEKTFEITSFLKATWVDQDHYTSVKGPDWPSYENFCLGNYDDVTTEIIEEIKQIFKISLQKNSLPTFLRHNDKIKVLDPIKNILYHEKFPRDLMSWLMTQTGLEISKDNQSYHQSNWLIDRKGMEKLVKIELLNPYSYHPTKKGHKILSNYFSEKLEKIFTDNV